MKERDFVKAFLALLLAGFLGGVVAGMVFGGIFGAIGAFTGSMAMVQIVAPVLSGLAGLALSYMFFRLFVLRFIVRKLAPQK
ncbi:MAG TPA: hypothetical protein VD867_18405 [Burkholderiales bacterium]|nr:hypothetical protein [Burkholderiales bacterium]